MAIETARPLNDVAASVRDAFEQRYAAAPECVAAAPGRVNLIGEHTDYNDGFVLPMAIDRYTVVAGSKRPDGETTARLFSVTMEPAIELPIEADGAELEGWAKYVRGVIDVYREAGVAVPAFDAVIDSTVPLGGGLSSSAALEVSLALVIEKLADAPQEGAARALLCQKAEHQAGTPCGIMDQFSSALCVADHAMLLDCRSQQPKMAELTDPDVTVLITNSNVKHELTGGEYAERREQCEAAAEALGVKALRDVTMEQVLAAEEDLGGLPFKRARHVVGENTRTERAAEALSASDWETFGRLMYESHAAMRDDFEITTPEIDKLVEIAQSIGPAGGVIGSRMTGGGFGGCTVTLVRSEHAKTVAATLSERYQAATGIQATCFITRPAQGGRLLES